MFKIGDEVVCMIATNYLAMGQEYEVCGIGYQPMVGVWVEVVGSSVKWFAGRFVLASEYFANN